MDNLFKNRSSTATPKESHFVFFEDLINTKPDMRVWLNSQGYHEVRYALPSFTFSQIAGVIYVNLYFLCALGVKELRACVLSPLDLITPFFLYDDNSVRDSLIRIFMTTRAGGAMFSSTALFSSSLHRLPTTIYIILDLVFLLG